MLNPVQKDVLLIHEDHVTESTELTFMMIAAALIKTNHQVDVVHTD